MTTKRLRYIKWWDWLLITLILFGNAIYYSTTIFFETNGKGEAASTAATASENWYMLVMQAGLLVLVFAYLWLRKFDFKQWVVSINWKATGIAVLLFLGLAVAMDLLFLICDSSFREYLASATFQPINGWFYMASQFSLSGVLYALLNGFYEEIYFIGICTVVEEKYRTPVFLISLLVRTSFHTYQGILSALGIGLILGIVYYVWYTKKDRNLYPIFLSHAFADMLGLGFLQYFFF